MTHCHTGYEVTYEDIVGYCAAGGGPEWLPASVPTAAVASVLVRIADAVRFNYFIIIGADGAIRDGALEFYWSHGRYAKRLFSRGLKADAVAVSPFERLWDVDQPDNENNKGRAVIVRRNEKLNDVTTTERLHCVACERSHCNLAADCSAAGTTFVRGFYPHCDCACREGFYGARANRCSRNVGGRPIQYPNGVYTAV